MEVSENRRTITFPNLLDVNTNEVVKVELPSKMSPLCEEQLNQVGKRAEAFGKQCTRIFQMKKRKVK